MNENGGKNEKTSSSFFLFLCLFFYFNLQFFHIFFSLSLYFLLMYAVAGVEGKNGGEISWKCVLCV